MWSAARDCRFFPSGEPRGALADFGLTQLAKIEAQDDRPDRALEILEEARGIQVRLHNPSLLRTVCLTARIDQSLTPARRIALRREAEVITSDRPGFLQCPLAREIVYHWDDWCAGKSEQNAPGKSDFFWGV